METAWVRLSATTRDTHRAVTGLAVGGLAAAAFLAVVGLPDVDLHGPLHHLGIMDPFCGATRAARFTARGELGLAWTYNPVGILAVVVALLGVIRLVTGTVSGRWASVDFLWTARRRRIAWLTLAVAVLALEVLQQSRADILVT